MKLRPVTLWGVAASAAIALLAAVLYHRLPEAIPVHWGLSGEADGFMVKPFGAFLYPAIIAASALLGTALPALAPRGFELTGFARAFDLIVLALIAFIAFLALAINAGAMGFPVSTTHLMGAAVGVLLIAIGNVMGKTTRNFFVGFRTPWTLASDEVWSRAHRFGGRLFVLCGLIFCAAAALGSDILVPGLAMLAAVLAVFVYSYVIYRKLEPKA